MIQCTRSQGRLFIWVVCVLAMSSALIAAVPQSQKMPDKRSIKPSISISRMPSVSPGESSWGTISGIVRGVDVKECHVVIYARGDTWYVQPWANNFETKISPDGKWSSGTHGGWEFAALLVKGKFGAPATTDTLPKIGGPILAIAKGTPVK